MSFIARIFNEFKSNQNRIIWFLYIVFLLISFPAVYTGSASEIGDSSGGLKFFKHIGFLLVSLGLVYGLTMLSLKKMVRYLTIGIYFGGTILAILTPLFGETINGAKRWIKIFGIPFQPSEITKLGIVLIGAYIFTRKDDFDRLILVRMLQGLKKWILERLPVQIVPKKVWSLEEKKIYLFLFAVAVPTLFIVLQNFSMAIIFVATTLGVIFISSGFTRTFNRLVALIVVGSCLFVSFLYFTPESVLDKLPGRFNTWKTRIDPPPAHNLPDSVYQNLPKEQKYALKFIETDHNMQPRRAKMAIAKGLGGVINGPGSSRARYDLPEASNDFIFAIILEEYGIIGAILIPFMYLLLIFQVASVGRQTTSKRYLILLYGITFLYVFQAFLNMLVAINLFPVTGQTLPLISTGGTSYIITSCGIGIILAIAKDSKKRMKALRESHVQDLHEETVGEEIQEETIYQQGASTEL